MARISDDDLNQLKRNVSIAELCRSRGIELKAHGRKDLIGKCPFHEDKNPSFVVTPDKNLFHCLGCDAAGSVIDLVMKLDKIEFRETVDKLLPVLSKAEGAATPQACPAKLSERSGMRRAAAHVEEENDGPKLSEDRIQQLLDRIVSVYAKTFAEVPEGREYLENRRINDAGLFTRHTVGYCNGRLNEILPDKGNIREELRSAGVLLKNGHERFTGCVVVPVFDIEGRITTLYGRFTGEGPKRHLFLPGRTTGLWNIGIVKTYPEIILVESVIDALSVEAAGFPNVVAIQGTNGLNDPDMKLLDDYGVRRIVLLLDGDEPGQKAALRLNEKLSSRFSCEMKLLPGNHDPNSFLLEYGTDKLAEFLAGTGEPKPTELPTDNKGKGPESGNSVIRRADGETGQAPTPANGGPGIKSDGLSVCGHAQAGSFTVAYGVRKYRVMGLDKSCRKLKATIRVEHAGKLHVDTLDFYSARSRRILAMDLCRIFEETPETIEADITRLLQECEKLPAHSAEHGDPKPVERITAKEKEDAETFGKAENLFDKILADFETCGLIGEENNKLLGYIAMTSRKRDVPLSVLILSSSGAGKTALQDTVCSFCPPEDMVKLTALSGKALFYKERLSLKNKVLALEEGDGAEEASYAIRNLISARELVSESTIKDLATGRLTTMENKVEGPSSVFLTTTNPEIDAETRSRFFVTSVDESREQTRRILLFQRRLHLSDGLITTPEIEAILKKHRNFQRLLKPLAVKNPYAAQLTYGDDRLQGRRDQPKYLNLIKAIAFLRQMRKEVFYENRNGSAVPYILVDRDDVKLANRLAHEILGHSLDELSRPGRDLLLLLDEMVEAIIKRLKKEENPSTTLRAGDRNPQRTAISFSRRDIREFTGWTNTRLHIHLKELADFEYIVVEAGRNGSPYRYRLAYEGQGKDGKRFMLGLKDVDGLSDSDGKASSK